VTIVRRNDEGETTTTKMVETHNEIDGATLVRFEGKILPKKCRRCATRFYMECGIKWRDEKRVMG
jgi:hypothetical protein